MAPFVCLPFGGTKQSYCVVMAGRNCPFRMSTTPFDIRENRRIWFFDSDNNPPLRNDRRVMETGEGSSVEFLIWKIKKLGKIGFQSVGDCGDVPRMCGDSRIDGRPCYTHGIPSASTSTPGEERIKKRRRKRISRSVVRWLAVKDEILFPCIFLAPILLYFIAHEGKERERGRDDWCAGPLTPARQTP